MQVANEALDGVVRAGYTHRVAFLMCNVAAYLIALGRYEEALAPARDGLRLARAANYAVAVAWALQHLAAVAALRPSDGAERVHEDRSRAARVLAYIDGRLTELDAVREYTEQQEYDKMIAALKAVLSEHELVALREEGRMLSEERAVTEALSI